MDDRAGQLRLMRICRFCLTEKEPLTNIYEKDTRNAIPLPLQIMACVAIEVFSNDGMPQLICDDCRLQTRKSYSFKTMCKRSDDSLKLFLATGILTKQEKEDILKDKSSNQNSDAPNPPKRKRSNENAENDKPVEKQTVSVETNTDFVELPELQPRPQIRPELEQPVPENFEIITEETEVESILPDYNVDMQQDQIAKPTPKQVITHCFPCPQCERSFPLQQLLDIHMRQHLRERKFSCSECGKKFFSKHDCLKHMQIHRGEKPYTCVVCDKSFSRQTLLHRHEKTHVSVPKYLCSYCDRTYLSSEDLDAHVVVHKKKRPFKCKSCDKCFAFKQGLERHEMIHNPVNEYKCNYCDESFTTAGKLARHVTTHAGARPYPCKICPRTFLLSHHLTRHLRNHYNRKQTQNESGEHKCDVCSMSFRRKDSLVNHTAIHSMVNLKCVICNKEFSDAKTVKEHVTTHLSGLPFPCDKCDYSFETQEELEDHEVKHIDIEDEEDEEYSPDTTDPLDNADEVVNVEPEPTQVKLRRSSRETKIKNYAEFLKDELGSDSEEDIDEPDEEEIPEEISPKIQIGTIQPVIRSETMKVYKGKEKLNLSTNQNVELEKLPENPVKTKTDNKSSKTSEIQQKITKITTLESLGLSKQSLEAMTEKSGVVEMKVGQKVIRVQKLMMTKAEYQAMAKQGKIEVKSGAIVVRNMDLSKLTQLNKNPDPLTETPKISEQKVDIAPNLEVQLPKTSVRTYVKKIGSKTKDDQSAENTNTNDKKDVVRSDNINLKNHENNTAPASVQEAEIVETN